MNYSLPLLTFLLGVSITIFVMSFFIRKQDQDKPKTTRWALMTFTEKSVFIRDGIRILLYLAILITSSTYVILHFSDCMQFEFFRDFDGQNTIFILCLALWILPIFSKFEMFGFVFEIWRNNEFTKQAEVAGNPNDILSPDSLEVLNKTTKKNSKNRKNGK